MLGSRPNLPPLVKAAALASLALMARPSSAAYSEAHRVGDDIRVTLARTGTAVIEHAVRYRVHAGALAHFDVTEVERESIPEPLATIQAEDGRQFPAHVAKTDDHTLRVFVDEPKGLRRGEYTFRFRYVLDLLRAGELERDGLLWRWTFTSPRAPEGFDSARVTLIVPPAPAEPRPLKTGFEGSEDGVLSTLRRAPDQDELELVRPHVSRGESPRWAARIDAKVFGGASVPAEAPDPMPIAKPASPRWHAAASGLLGLMLFALSFTFVRRKQIAIEADPSMRPLLPKLGWARPLLSAAALVTGLGLQFLGHPVSGTLFLVFVMLAGTWRTVPPVRSVARGPGRWLPLRPRDAFHRQAPASWTPPITWILVAVGIVTLGVIWALFSGDGRARFLAAADLLVLAPVLATGHRVQRKGYPEGAGARLLESLYADLVHSRDVRVVPWARFVGSIRDELRLFVLPRAPIPGLTAIEVGVAWSLGPSGWFGRPELLVRAHEGTQAALRMLTLAPGTAPTAGRKPEERVVRVVPTGAASGAIGQLLREVIATFTDRRTQSGFWAGVERRGEPRGEAPGLLGCDRRNSADLQPRAEPREGAASSGLTTLERPSECQPPLAHAPAISPARSRPTPSRLPADAASSS